MIEKTGNCPLCGEEFGSDENNTVCPECGIKVYKHVPLFRVSRSWFWRLTDEATGKLLVLWRAAQAKKKPWLMCPKCGGNLFISYEQQVEYPLTLIEGETNYCEVDEDNAELFSSELLRVRCAACNEQWLSLDEVKA